MYKRTSSILGTLVAAVALLAMSASAQTSLKLVTLGASTTPNGIVFTSTGATGGLSVDIGGCPFGSTSCTAPGFVSGALTVSGFGGNYSLNADSLTGSFLSESPSGVDAWSLSGGADTFGLSVTGISGGFTGTISWLQAVENTSGVSLIGSVNYMGTGILSSSSGTVGISVQLAPLTCNSSVTGPCTLADVSGEPGDPPAAFSSVGSGSFSNTPPVIGATPEPGSLLLLGTGLLCVAPFIRRRFARA